MVLILKSVNSKGCSNKHEVIATGLMKPRVEAHVQSGQYLVDRWFPGTDSRSPAGVVPYCLPTDFALES